MKKVINITIGKTVFLIEDDAYLILKKYLESIRTHYQLDEGVDDIVSDIEYSIAEKFIARGLNAESSIGLSDVEYIIKEMGTVEELLEDSMEGSATKHQQEKSDNSKRLYRDTEDVVIAGVASGIARYFGIDATVIRILFAISIFFGGFGILAYFLLWVIVPVADTAFRKIHMDGGRATVSEIETFVKKKMSQAPKSKWKKLLSFPFIIIRKIFAKLSPVLSVIVGGSIMLASLVGLFVFSTSFAVIISGAGSTDPILAVITNILSQDFLGTLVFIGIYLLVVIPLLLIIFLGVSLIRRKRTLGWLGLIILFIIWFISANVVAIKTFTHIDQIETAVRNAKLEIEATQTHQSYDDLIFNKVSIAGYMNVVIQKGDEHTVLVEGSEHALENIIIDVRDGYLDIDRNKGFSFCIFICQDLFSRTKVTITTPELESINFSGSVIGEMDEFESQDFSVRFSGSSKYTIRTISKTVDVRSSGSSKLTLIGETNELSLHLSGSSKIQAYDLHAQKTSVRSSGSSRIELSVKESLDVNASGSTQISYIDQGDVVVNKHISGSGRVIEILIEDSENQE